VALLPAAIAALLVVAAAACAARAVDAVLAADGLGTPAPLAIALAAAVDVDPVTAPPVSAQAAMSVDTAKPLRPPPAIRSKVRRDATVPRVGRATPLGPLTAARCAATSASLTDAKLAMLTPNASSQRAIQTERSATARSVD